MKTTREIINQTPKFDINDAKEKLDYHFNTKWYSEKELRLKLLDMYRFMCNEYGKANVWSMNADELLDNVDLLIEKKLFNAPDLNSRSSGEDSLNKGPKY